MSDNYPAGVNSNAPYFDLPDANDWVMRVEDDGGESCPNCAQWRFLDHPIIEECPACGDEEINIYLASERFTADKDKQ